MNTSRDIGAVEPAARSLAAFAICCFGVGIATLTSPAIASRAEVASPCFAFRGLVMASPMPSARRIL